MLLPDFKHDNRHPTGTICTTDACTGGHDSTSGSSPQNSEPWTEEQRQLYLQEQRHAQHHHHLNEEHFKTRNPEEGERYQKQYIL
jgi:hypothetical protein